MALLGQRHAADAAQRGQAPWAAAEICYPHPLWHNPIPSFCEYCVLWLQRRCDHVHIGLPDQCHNRLAAGVQAQQQMNRVLCDVQTLQMKNQQELFSLLQSRLERVS